VQRTQLVLAAVAAVPAESAAVQVERTVPAAAQAPSVAELAAAEAVPTAEVAVAAASFHLELSAEQLVE
jgi:hypothetical protein